MNIRIVRPIPDRALEVAADRVDRTPRPLGFLLLTQLHHRHQRPRVIRKGPQRVVDFGPKRPRVSFLQRLDVAAEVRALDEFLLEGSGRPIVERSESPRILEWPAYGLILGA